MNESYYMKSESMSDATTFAIYKIYFGDYTTKEGLSYCCVYRTDNPNYEGSYNTWACTSNGDYLPWNTTNWIFSIMLPDEVFLESL